MTSRHAGLMLPLFSAASSRSWGIGELPDIVPLAAWLESAGFDRLMLLPIGTVAEPETSPYSALSAMAIDPSYVALDDVPDFPAAGGPRALPVDIRNLLEEVKRSPGIRYVGVRRVKQAALDLAFSRFVSEEWNQLTTRAAALAGYITRERWWLDEYALYCAISRAVGTADWRLWPPPVRDRQPRALDDIRRQLAREMLRHQYLQWIAEEQWQAARAGAAERGVTIFGDLPFMVSASSPDVWARQDEFMFDVSLGVPPDAFSEEGQDWRMPTYRWARIAETEYSWIQQRARRMASLYSGYRIDHLVGFYRTYGRPRGGADPFFSPSTEDAQTTQGEAILRIFLDSGADIVAEDLGLVPDFVRASLARLGVPGSKVLRWERDYHAPGRPFTDPRWYPEVSAALTGTHDTPTVAQWWDEAGEDERAAFLELPHVAARVGPDPAQPWSDALRDATVELSFHAASRELFVVMQDVFGWRDRINVPGTINDANWTWRLPWPVDELGGTPDTIERAAFCRRTAVASGRAGRVGERSAS